MTKELDDIIFNCDHELLVEIGQTDKEETEMLSGRVHYYLNCLVCSTTLLRDENFYKGYQYSGVELSGGPMYHKKGFKNEYK